MARTEPPLPWNLLFTCSCPPRFLVKSKHNQHQKGIWRPHLTIHHLFTGLETTKVKNVEQKPLLLRVKLWSERGTVDKWSQRKGGTRVREKTDSVSPYFDAPYLICEELTFDNIQQCSWAFFSRPIHIRFTIYIIAQITLLSLAIISTHWAIFLIKIL